MRARRYPGATGGRAVAEALFGYPGSNRFGKLPFTYSSAQRTELIRFHPPAIAARASLCGSRRACCARSCRPSLFLICGWAGAVPPVEPGLCRRYYAYNFTVLSNFTDMNMSADATNPGRSYK